MCSSDLRDLFDLDSLLRQFSAEPGFWNSLVPRAVRLGLARPLCYALRYVTHILATPVPPEVMAASMAGAPPRLVLRLMDACYLRVLRPFHDSCRIRGTWLARFALYARAHWIRMPMTLLVYHLAHKALVRARLPEAEPAPVHDRTHTV